MRGEGGGILGGARGGHINIRNARPNVCQICSANQEMILQKGASKFGECKWKNERMCTNNARVKLRVLKAVWMCDFTDFTVVQRGIVHVQTSKYDYFRCFCG